MTRYESFVILFASAVTGSYATAAATTITIPSDASDGIILGDGSTSESTRPGRVGTGTTPIGFPGRAGVFVFALPAWDGAAPPVVSATLAFSITGTVGSRDYGIDLYGLTARDQPTLIGSDFFAGADDATDATVISRTLIAGADVPDGRIVTSNEALRSYISEQYLSGASGDSRYLFIRLNPDTSTLAAVNSGISVPFSGAGVDVEPSLTMEFVTGTAVPEPNPSLVGLGVVAGLLHRQRRGG